MEMPDHAWISALPTGAQFAINAAIGVATLVGLWACLSQVRKAKTAPSPMAHRSDDIAMPMIQIADMSPVRHLVEEVRRLVAATDHVAAAQELIAQEHHQIREQFHDWMTEEEIERRVRQRAGGRANG